MRNYHGFFVCFISMFISQVVFAGVAEQILKTAWEDASVKQVKERRDELESPGSSYIRQSHIFYGQGTKYNEDNVLIHKVGLKFQPFSLQEIKIQKNQMALTKINLSDAELAKALLDRYELIIDYVQTIKKCDLLIQVTGVAKKNFKAQLLASKIGKSDAKKVVSARLNLARMQLYLDKTINLKNRLKSRIQSLASVDLKELKDSKKWIAPEEMLKKIKLFSTEDMSLSTQLKQYESNDLNAEQALFKARREALIDYLELTYHQTDKVNEKETGVEFKISFNLPFFTKEEGGAIDNRRRLQKSISAFKSIHELKSQYEDNIQRLIDQISTYSELTDFYNNSGLYTKSLSVDPQMDIETLFEILSARTEFFELEKDIRLQYIRLIFESGRMLSTPGVNFLLLDESMI